MKKIITPLVICFSLFSFSSFAQSENQTMQNKPKTEKEAPKDKEDEVDKTEIPSSQLPEEARREITDNYHNATIIQAWKLNYGEDRHGYLVEVKQGPKKWTIEFDKEGNATNKIIPIKM